MTSQEFFRNVKRPPTPDSKEYEPFFANELDKIHYGVTINGVFIDPWLYWHLNHWSIYINDTDDRDDSIKRIFTHPTPRDNEWALAEARAEAIKQKKGLVAIGIRRFGKSEIEASIIARSATIFQGSENVVSSGNDKDLGLITDKLERGLTSVHPYFKWDRVEDNWKRQVTLGIKKKSGEKLPFSYILLRNYDEGLNSESAAGITAKEFIIDEIGKFLFLRAFEAAMPAFTSEFGWICSPLLVGTGGAFEKGSDAEKVFLDPDGHNMLGFTWRDEPKKIGFFVGHTNRLEAKVDTTLGEWVSTNRGILIPKESELYTIPFKMSDPLLADKVTDAKRAQKKKAADPQAYLKEVMYYPKNPQECFLTLGNAFYNSEAARAQKARLLQMGRLGTPIVLFEDGQEIKHQFSDKGPVTNWPARTMDDKDAPIIIYEFPMENPPFGLYIAGIDPYKQDVAKYSDSLGVVYIYKRIHDILGEGYKDVFVASFAARPKDIQNWYTQARLLIKFYNARALCENEDMGFIEHMIYKGDGHFLEDQPEWLREIVPNTQVNRKKGIHRSSSQIRTYLHSVLKGYFDEKIGVRRNEKDEVIGDILGITRVMDPMLMEEVSRFNEEDNFDREVAASLCIALAKHLDPQYIVSSTEKDIRLKAYFERAKSPTYETFVDRPTPSFITRAAKFV